MAESIEPNAIEAKSLQTIAISKDNSFLYNSEKIPVKPNQKYRVTTNLIGKKGEPYSAYFAVIILNSIDREIIRHIRWITDFNGEQKDYTLVFTTGRGAENAVLGYRFNVETPYRSDMELDIFPHSSLKIEEISNNVDELFDDLDDYERPNLPPLTEEEENHLEKKIVWILGSGRSGTTWLGTELLRHDDNIIWNEPTIGYHLNTRDEDFRFSSETGGVPADYFFAPQHMGNWLAPLRKLILARAYSQTRTLTKNVIIKEPGASIVADIIMRCFSNSKLIFMLRDGRDVVESWVDSHRTDSWHKIHSTEPLLTQESRYEAIKKYSRRWKRNIETVWKTFQTHSPELRHLIKYEELKKDTLTELQKLYDFLEIRISNDDLMTTVQRYEFKNIPDSEKGPGKFNRAAATGSWRTSFSEKEQELMNSIMGETLTQMDYKI